MLTYSFMKSLWMNLKMTLRQTKLFHNLQRWVQEEIGNVLPLKISLKVSSSLASISEDCHFERQIQVNDSVLWVSANNKSSIKNNFLWCDTNITPSTTLITYLISWVDRNLDIFSSRFFCRLWIPHLLRIHIVR